MQSLGISAVPKLTSGTFSACDEAASVVTNRGVDNLNGAATKPLRRKAGTAVRRTTLENIASEVLYKWMAKEDV
jgi:hypothetical protein